MDNYCVESEPTLANLVASVNQMLKIGYLPIGGISFVEGRYIQAMAKTEALQRQNNDVIGQLKEYLARDSFANDF